MGKCFDIYLQATAVSHTSIFQYLNLNSSFTRNARAERWANVAKFILLNYVIKDIRLFKHHYDDNFLHKYQFLNYLSENEQYNAYHIIHSNSHKITTTTTEAAGSKILMYILHILTHIQIACFSSFQCHCNFDIYVNFLCITIREKGHRFSNFSPSLSAIK